MMFGVGYNWLFFSGFGSMFAFLLITPLVGLIAFPILYVVGLIIYARDPHMPSILMRRLKVGATANRKFWQGNSYSG